MAFKLPGAPMHDTSSKHGANANYKKSGVPGLLGKILDPLGLKNKLMGGGKNCPPAGQPQAAAPAPDAPAQPAAPAPAAAAATDPAAAPMKEDLMTERPPKKVIPKTDPRKPKKVDPRTDPRYAHKLHKAKNKKK